MEARTSFVIIIIINDSIRSITLNYSILKQAYQQEKQIPQPLYTARGQGAPITTSETARPCRPQSLGLRPCFIIGRGLDRQRTDKQTAELSPLPPIVIGEHYQLYLNNTN